MTMGTTSSAARTVIITGGGTGIGAAIALRLGADGCAVVASYSKSKDGAEAVADKIQKAGGSASTFRANVTNAKEVAQLFDHAEKEHGPIYAVISNAGIGHASLIAESTDEDYDRIFDTNTRGTFNVCREGARRVVNGGRIINISTGITHRSAPTLGIYAASKLAVEGFTKTLAQELGGRGITVNTVSPGMTDTPMLDGAEDPDALRKWGISLTVLKRLGQSDDIADAVGFLVSNDGRWVNGQNMRVDGGGVIT